MIEKRVIFLSGILLWCCHLGASTIAVPAPGYQLGASDDVNGATCTQAPGTCAIGGASATISMSPLPFLTARAVGNADAIANANYYFVVGNAAGTADTTIPIDVSYSLFTQEDGAPGNNTQARASVQVTSAIEQASDAVGLFGNPSQAAGVLHVNALSGRNNAVAVFATAGGNAGSAFATADPYIYIDPSFVNTAGYTITVSDGVGNTPASSAPEPASLVLVGLVLSGAAFFRRPSGRTRQAPR